ncbi:MAG: hypothetical protein ABI834_10525 [Ginsengibacter sp.]
MINIKYLLFYSFMCVSLLSCAQSKHLIKNIYATYSVHLPGNVAVDRNGNSISLTDTLSIIYIETASEKIHWFHAWKGAKDYSIITTLITELPFNAGTNKMTNEKIILRSTKGNKLWKLQLVPGEKFFMAPLKILQGEIILQGIYHGKKITQKIFKQIELVSIPSV